MNDHSDLARAAFDAVQLPDPPRTVHDALRYIMRLLSILPVEEGFGYVAGPAGGSNVAPLFDGTLVRISRVMDRSGQIVKVLSDAPNGNPQWVLEDVRPDLYVTYTGTVTLPPGPTLPPFPDAGDMMDHLDALTHQVQILQQTFVEISRQIGLLNDQLANLDRRVLNVENRPMTFVGFGLHTHAVRLGPITVISGPPR